MKYIYLFLICIVYGSSCFAQSVCPEINIFEAASNAMINGINNRNKSAINDAIEGYSYINFAAISSDDYTIIGEEALCEPTIIFDRNFCKNVLKNNFNLVEMTELDMERALADDGSVAVIDGAVKPGRKVSYILEANEQASIAIACCAENSLKCEITVDGDLQTPVTNENGYTCHADLNIGADFKPVTISLSNISNSPISFTIALH